MPPTALLTESRQGSDDAAGRAFRARRSGTHEREPQRPEGGWHWHERQQQEEEEEQSRPIRLHCSGASSTRAAVVAPLRRPRRHAGADDAGRRGEKPAYPGADGWRRAR